MAGKETVTLYLITLYNSGAPLVIRGEFAAVADCKVVGERNAIDSMTFTIYPGNPGYDAMTELATTIECVDVRTGEMVFEGRILAALPSMDSDGVVCKAVTCEGLAGYLCDSVQPYVEETTYTDDSSRTGLQKFVDLVLANHNARVPEHKRVYRGTVDMPTFATASSVTKQLNFERTWDALSGKLLDSFGGELRVRRGTDGKLYLDYRQKLGTLSNVRISVGRNMLSASRELKPDQLITRLYPRGCKLTKTVADKDGTERDVETEERLAIGTVNAGCDYIDDDEAVKLYGIIEGKHEWDDVTEPQHLKDKAQRWLAENNQLPVSTTIDGYDLELLGIESDKISLYGWYPCSNPLIGLAENLEVVKATINISEPSESSWEFGETAARQSSKMLSLKDLANQVQVVKSQSSSNVTNIRNLVVYTKAAIEVSGDAIKSTVGKQIVETTETINGKIDGVDNRLTGEIKTVSSSVSTLEQKADSITATVQQLSEDQSAMQSTIEEMPDSIKLEVTKGYTQYVAGELAPVNESISELKVTSEGITSRVEQMERNFVRCITAADQQAKQIIVSGFTEMYVGATVCVKFTYANTAAMPTLTISGVSSSTGYILLNDKLLSASDYWCEGDVITFAWSGSYWNVVDAGARSRIKQLADSITLEVSGKLGSTASIVMSVDGAKTTQNIDMSGVRNAFRDDTSAIAISAGTVTFNSGTFVVNSTYFNVSKYGVITATRGDIGGFSISAYSLSNDTMTLSGSGLSLRVKTSATAYKSVGLIGVNSLAGDDSKHGLNFDLNEKGSYMTWAAKTSASDSVFKMMLTYAKDKLKDYDAGRLHAGCPTDFHNYKLYNAWIDPNTGGANGGITGTFKTYQVAGINTDTGALTRWSTNPAYMTFKNGLLIDMYRYDF